MSAMGETGKVREGVCEGGKGENTSAFCPYSKLFRQFRSCILYVSTHSPSLPPSLPPSPPSLQVLLLDCRTQKETLVPLTDPNLVILVTNSNVREGAREGGREGGRKGGREGGRDDCVKCSPSTVGHRKRRSSSR